MEAYSTLGAATTSTSHTTVLTEDDLLTLTEHLRKLVVHNGGRVHIRLYAIDDRGLVHRGTHAVLVYDHERLELYGAIDLHIRFTDFTKALHFPSADWSYFAVEAAVPCEDSTADDSGAQQQQFVLIMGNPRGLQEAESSGDVTVRETAILMWHRSYMDHDSSNNNNSGSIYHSGGIMPRASPVSSAAPAPAFRESAYTMGVVAGRMVPHVRPAWEPGCEVVGQSPHGLLVYYPSTWLPVAEAYGKGELKRRLVAALDLVEVLDESTDASSLHRKLASDQAGHYGGSAQLHEQQRVCWGVLAQWIDAQLRNFMPSWEFDLAWDMVSRLLVLQEKMRQVRAYEETASRTGADGACPGSRAIGFDIGLEGTPGYGPRRRPRTE